MALDTNSVHREITPTGIAEPLRPAALCPGFTARFDSAPFIRPRPSKRQISWLQALIGTRGLEFHATHWKQRAVAISNRDKKGLLHLARIRGKAKFLIANPRLEILANYSRERVETKSDRKFIAIFQMRNRLVRPAQDHGSRGVSSAHGDQENQIALAQALLLERVHEPQRNRGGGGVAEVVDVDEDLRIVDAQAILHRANDA